MKRTKFPYQYQQEQVNICPDCKQSVFEWYKLLLNKIANSGNLELAEQIVNELPFPLPEEREKIRRWENDPRNFIREHIRKTDVGTTEFNGDYPEIQERLKEEWEITEEQWNRKFSKNNSTQSNDDSDWADDDWADDDWAETW